jgi:predicted permease
LLEHRKFSFDLQTLSKLNTFFLLPAVCFTNLYKGEITILLLSQIVSFLVINTFLLIVVSSVISRMSRFETGLSASFKNSMVLINAGNFGLPVSELVFHSHPIGLSIAVIVSAYQNIVTFTFGLFNSATKKQKGKGTMKEMLKQPIIYGLLLAMILRWLHVEIPSFIWNPVESMANAFLAIALVTLGAQIANLKIQRLSRALALSIVGRLMIGPVIAYLLIILLGLDGVTAQALFIASSFPTSRNSALLALEFNNQPEFAAQAVLLTTVASSVTVTIVVYLATYLF